MPRRIDLEQRRAQLAEALWEIIREQGVSAVSLRTVAHRAEVVLGSLRHVFPTRSALLTYSAELMIQRVTDRVRAVPQGGDQIEYAQQVLTHLLPTDEQSRAEMEINVALIAESPAEPNLVEIRDRARREVFGLCRRIAETLSPRTEPGELDRSAMRLHALVDGLALHLMQLPDSADPAWAIEILRDELMRLQAKEVRR